MESLTTKESYEKQQYQFIPKIITQQKQQLHRSWRRKHQSVKYFQISNQNSDPHLPGINEVLFIYLLIDLLCIINFLKIVCRPGGSSQKVVRQKRKKFLKYPQQKGFYYYFFFKKSNSDRKKTLPQCFRRPWVRQHLLT